MLKFGDATISIPTGAIKSGGASPNCGVRIRHFNSYWCD